MCCIPDLMAQSLSAHVLLTNILTLVLGLFKCAVSGDGELSLRELASLLRDLRLPDVTNADILYIMVWA